MTADKKDVYLLLFHHDVCVRQKTFLCVLIRHVAPVFHRRSRAPWRSFSHRPGFIKYFVHRLVEKVGVGQDRRHVIQSAQHHLRSLQRHQQAGDVDRRGGRQRRRHEGARRFAAEGSHFVSPEATLAAGLEHPSERQLSLGVGQ